MIYSDEEREVLKKLRARARRDKLKIYRNPAYVDNFFFVADAEKKLCISPPMMTLEEVENFLDYLDNN